MIAVRPSFIHSGRQQGTEVRREGEQPFLAGVRHAIDGEEDVRRENVRPDACRVSEWRLMVLESPLDLAFNPGDITKDHVDRDPCCGFDPLVARFMEPIADFSIWWSALGDIPRVLSGTGVLE
jgi:hypothetical protein